MKKLITLCLALVTMLGAKAQQLNPVNWMATYKSISATEGEIIITAKIEKGWHTYSQRPTDAGPIPTSIQFNPSSQFQLLGKTTETDAHEEFVKAFDAKIFVFTDKAEFKQKIKLNAKPGFTVVFKVEYMTCNDMMCLPPKMVDLTVKIQ
ncbi:MAG: sugar transporter [Bacteroidia bacterium]|nr:sugar transporter [Bacteroidia bacterium]